MDKQGMTWEQKIDNLVRLAKDIGVYLDVEREEPGSDYTRDIRKRLLAACEEFCEWRHDEPYVVDEIKGLLTQRNTDGLTQD